VDWLNMPLKKSQREIQIKDLQFRENSMFEINKFLVGDRLSSGEIDFLFDIHMSPIALLCRQLQWVADKLSFECKLVRSSDFQIDDKFRGEDRVIEIVKLMNATEYVNSSGGIEIYDENNFSKNGIKLKIFSPYTGPNTNILDRIVTENLQSIKSEINDQIKFQIGS